MQEIGTVRGLQAWADAERAAGRRIALVPTLGALHAAHLALVERARARADRVVVSIFLNPTQFGPGEDFERYPRPLEADLSACRKAGVDVVFHPSVSEMYPEGYQTSVEVAELTRPLCGRFRPGHFGGVTTIVAKLLLAAKPHAAVFGEKDFQQLAAIRRMVRDLGFDVEIDGHPTVRDADGLATSSRNAGLDAETRREALALPRALAAAERAVASGERSRDRLLRQVELELAKAPRGEVDYAELRDADTLDPAPERLAGPALLALAVRFPAGSGGSVRLIDNCVLLRPASSPDAREDRT